MRRLQVLFLLLVFLLSSAPLYSQEYSQRIISLGPAITEELYLLGVGDRIVANTVYCKRPSDAEKKEKLGTVIKVDLEKIVKLKPDLVLATSLTDREQLQIMKNLRINVIEIPTAKNFQDICGNFLKVGELVGKRREAEKIIEEVKIKVGSIREKTKHLPRQKVIVQVGAKPLYVATKRYFVDDFIEFAGGINIAGDSETGLYSREKVLKQNPDVIIIVAMGIIGEKEKETWQRYKTLNAVRNNRIYIVDSYRLCSPTPVTFVETLEEIVKILHPEKIGE
jgi:iron complex transport system substrate-binding protein